MEGKTLLPIRNVPKHRDSERVFRREGVGVFELKSILCPAPGKHRDGETSLGSPVCPKSFYPRHLELVAEETSIIVNARQSIRAHIRTQDHTSSFRPQAPSSMVLVRCAGDMNPKFGRDFGRLQVGNEVRKRAPSGIPKKNQSR